MSRKHTKQLSITAITFALLFSCIFGNMVAYAKEAELPIAANVYELDDDSHYAVGEASPSKTTAIGDLLINGSLDAGADVNDFSAYNVKSGNASFSYVINPDIANRSSTEWHLTDDKSKKVNGITLDSNILSGALILQTSLDGVTWTEDVLRTNIFAEDSNTKNFYETKDVQLQNGCYYRVIIAYKIERQLENSKILFVTTHNYEYKQIAELYEFYVSCDSSETSADATPMKKLGSKINTGKDNGYSGNEPIDKDDPHYGWDIGYFYINGYTRETETSDQIPVFLKNVGDRVTLWFHLSEDITSLHGNENLTINEDSNGYDREFEIDQTNFEHGTLIIQYTNPQGEAETPIIYTDYLAANTRTGANTKVQLFEEGDYTVTLDYEIKSMGGPFNRIASYNNYKIQFPFSIRNGNCMVYPFDSVTGAELSDNALTESGFKLDMAKSKYLTIDVKKSILTVGTDGYLTADVRFNRPAKDGEEYSDDGIYTFDVTNLYTNQHTTKTIYVGTDSYLRALSATGMSIAELNAQIESGAIIHEDGSIEALSATVGPSSEPITENEDLTAEEPIPEENKDIIPEETQKPDTTSDGIESPQKLQIAPFVFAGLAIVLILMFIITRKHKNTIYDGKEESK